MKSLIFTSLFCFLVSSLFGQGFTTTWQTDVNSIYIPGNGVNYTVSWTEVGNPSVSGSTTISYGASVPLPHPGTFQVSISGGSPAFSAIKFAGSTEGRKLLSIDQWGNIPWTSMANAFQGCRNLEFAPIDTPDLRNVLDLSQMFEDCWIFNGDISNWNTSHVTKMTYMFHNAYAFNQPIENWNTSNVADMGAMFLGALVFNQPIGNWNTSNVRDMNYMFGYANQFNQPIGAWDMSKVVNTAFMFGAATNFNQPLDQWDMSNDTNMVNMFYQSGFNQPIGSWNTAKVANMSSMFDGATNFNHPINTWNTTNVKDMSNMFSRTSSFNQSLNSWNVTNVANMYEMFYNARAFNQPLNSWNTEKVGDMGYMFVYDSSFNQNLGNWNIENVLNMENMLSVSGITANNYDSTLIGWNNQSVRNGVLLGATGLKYCNGQTQRSNLISTHSWVITGDALDCGSVVTNVILCSGGDTSFMANFSGISYQWQIDSGFGFIDIIDDINYSGSHTNNIHLNQMPSSCYGYQYRCVVDGVNTKSFKIQFANKWLGVGDTSWENPSNWSCGLVPDIYTDVTLNTGTAIINISTTIRSLTISSSANLIVNSPATIKITH